MDRTHDLSQKASEDFAAFDDLLDRFGADPSAWPRSSRVAALALLERSAQARAAQAEVAAIEAALRRRSSPRTTPGVIAARAMRQAQRKPVVLGWRHAAWVAAAAAAIVLGVAVGRVKDHNEATDHMFAAWSDNSEAVDVD